MENANQDGLSRKENNGPGGGVLRQSLKGSIVKNASCSKVATIDQQYDIRKRSIFDQKKTPYKMDYTYTAGGQREELLSRGTSGKQRLASQGGMKF